MRENMGVTITNPLQEKLERARRLLREMESVLVAFSGGVDSTYLLFMAHQELGERAVALLASSPTYPEPEIQKAREIAALIKVPCVEIQTRELEEAQFTENTIRRCYFCKKELFALCWEKAKSLGLKNVADGANRDDTGDYRPGMEAARELGVRSPLMEAGLGKAEIRELSRAAGLPTWDKPSMACLASRFPYGTRITPQRLKQIQATEAELKEMGFKQLRVRYHGDLARIEVEPSEIHRLLDARIRGKIVQAFKEQGFTYITLDLQGYRSGSLNEILMKSKA